MFYMDVLQSLNETNSEHNWRQRLLNTTAKTNELQGLFILKKNKH